MKIEKILAVILTVILLFAAVPFGTFTASAATSGTTGDCTWSLDGTVLTICGNGDMGNYSYYSKSPWGTSITEVIIEKGVTSIGYYAFRDCSSLTSITIPDSVTSIGDDAFENCSSLTSITIPDSVTSIGQHAFTDCSSLTSITIPDSVTSIDDYAFAYCSSLTSITIPDSVTSIGDHAFADCSSLTSITIPDSVTSIGSWAFYDCDSLTSITIPNSVTSIDKHAFSSCSSLTSITIPDSVTSIGSDAFEFCSSLKNVYITDITAWCNISFSNAVSNPMYYADNLYLNNKLVISITLPDSVTSICDCAFLRCNSLTSITIPDSVTSIGSCAFMDCRSLTSITIPDSVTSIGSSAFYNTAYYNDDNNWENEALYIGNHLINVKTSILGEYTIKSDTKTISDSAFKGCSSLTSIIIPDSVTSIGGSAFVNCSSLTSITIPDDVTSIGSYTFLNCSSLRSITIPNSVTSIGYCAFDSCNSLRSITIPNSVTSVGWGAFYDCSSLTSITIPDSVTSIGFSAFTGCSSLTSITIPDSVTSIGSDAFYNTAYYNDDNNWENEVLYIGNHLIRVNTSILGKYTIKSNTKTISGSSFYECSSLTSITIPDSVTSIGGSAFYNCSSLTSIAIPDSVTSIGGSAFENCSSLTSITIPDNVTSIGSSAFENCSSLENVYITDIGAWCNIPFGNSYSNPMYYADNLYINNQLLTEIKIPQDTPIIGTYQFYNCKSIENIFVPKSTVLIKPDAFYNCNGIKNIYYEGTAEEWAEVTILSGNDYFTNATVYYNCTGIPDSAISAQITKLPDKLQYIENKESLDLTGGVLTVYYDGGATKEIELTELNVKGFDNTALGKQTLTVKYGEFSDTFEVEIIPRPMTFIAISTFPTKTAYTVGEGLDLTGGKLTVGYPEGNYEIFDLTADMVTGFDTNKAGIQILTVTYKGYTTTFAVEVFEKTNHDLDGDGIINANDVVILRKEIFNINAYNEIYDINGDGSIDIRDIINLKKQIAYIN